MDRYWIIPLAHMRTFPLKAPPYYSVNIKGALARIYLKLLSFLLMLTKIFIVYIFYIVI